MTDHIAARARRRTAVVVAAGAAVVLVTTVVAVGLVALLGQSNPRRPITPPSAVTTDSLVASEVEPSVPAASPDAAGELSWTTVAGARVPVSRSAGPRDTSSGRARGFAHNPLGAVLAAAHISLRLSAQVGPQVFGPTLREQVVGGDAAALGQQLEDDYEQARARLGLPYGQPAGRLYSTAHSYRVDQDSPTTAAVRLLIEGPGENGAPVLIELRLRTKWLGEDWALQAPSGGAWASVTALVTDASGYTPFSDGG
ncbi:hypothetical protein [Phytohabitans aurantiacus]|uniref:DUF8175 domain-containing protein n=1 Tax=Phytohabitans aurantiacus TaxID=3016789 RepID=A0ABQ5R2A5_9ACTN|nr:hypothetical protein [Phytohabitans aurantiacus]GLI00914.1 hypothetical protein Pa4123_61900 [Phytohabitans aurantiacus]